jgi:hypothetical protein
VDSLGDLAFDGLAGEEKRIFGMCSRPPGEGAAGQEHQAKNSDVASPLLSPGSQTTPATNLPAILRRVPRSLPCHGML